MDQRASPSVNSQPATGVARVAGHFGELVQGRLGSNGPVALATLRCPVLASRARFAPGSGRLVVEGAQTGKVARAVEPLLARLAGPGVGGRLTIARDAAPGAGAGSSTADVLAAVRAIAAALGARLAAEEEARICLTAEGAVDPLMHAPDVLFAPREARVLETLPPLPPLAVAGGFAGPGRATDPNDHDFPDMSAAFARLRAAARAGDPAGIAAAARISAEANQARNPNPAWRRVLAIGARTGAIGPVVSHTGSAIGLLYAPGVDTGPILPILRAAGLDQVLDFSTCGD